MPSGPIGCPETRILVQPRGGYGRSPFEVGSARNWSTVEWSRVEENISGCQVRVEGRARCCDWLAKVKPWRDEIAVFRGEDRVWSGPITMLSFTGDELRVDCKDRAQWLQRRVIHNDHTFGAGTDLATVLSVIIDDAMSVDRSPQLAVSAVPTGVRLDQPEGRVYLAATHQYAMDALQELARTGVSWTCLDRTLYCGPVATATGTEPTLLASHFQEYVDVDVDGFDFGTRFYVSGSSDGAGGDPVYGTNPVDPALEAMYGVVEVSMPTENAIRDVNTARVGAIQNFRVYGQGGPPTYINGGRLTPNAPVDINSLIPGQTLRLHLSPCPNVSATMRLVGVNGSVGPEHDWVSIAVEPVAEPIAG